MVRDTADQTQFNNDSEKNIPESILKLDQKLKGVLSEIDNKLHNCFAYNGDDKEQYVDQLSALAQELVQAIDGLEHLVALVSPLDFEAQKEFYRGAEMQEFNALVTDKLQKIEQLDLDILP